MMLRSRKVLGNEQKIAVPKKKGNKTKAKNISESVDVLNKGQEITEQKCYLRNSPVSIKHNSLSDNEKMFPVLDRSVRESQGGKLSVTLTTTEATLNLASEMFAENMNDRRELTDIFTAPAATVAREVVSVGRVVTPVASHNRVVKITSRRRRRQRSCVITDVKGLSESDIAPDRRTTVNSASGISQDTVQNDTLNSDVVVLDTSVPREIMSKNIERMSSEVVTHSRKRKLSEHDVEVVYDLCKKKKRRSSEDTQKTKKRVSSLKQSKLLHVINNGRMKEDDVISLSESDDEVLVVDPKEESSSLKNDVIVLESTPPPEVEKKKKMVSASTSVTGLIPHYAKSLTDFIPLQTNCNTPRGRHLPAAFRKRPRIRGRANVPHIFHRNRFLDSNHGNRPPGNNNFSFQQFPPPVLPVVTPSTDSNVTAKSTAPLGCGINNLPPSLSTAQKVTQSPASSYGNNIYNPSGSKEPNSGLRPVIIDGSNVALGHTNGKFFSWKGLHICLKYFLKRGHKVTAFVPTFRKAACPQDLRTEMDKYEKEGQVVFTPSRKVAGRLIVPYDDRFIVQCAAELGGVIVSTDNYRDLLTENQSWKDTIEKRLLMFTWVGDLLMFPDDPLGRHGPKLKDFLTFPPK